MGGDKALADNFTTIGTFATGFQSGEIPCGRGFQDILDEISPKLKVSNQVRSPVGGDP